MQVTLNLNDRSDIIELHRLAKRYPLPEPQAEKLEEKLTEVDHRIINYMKAKGGKAHWAEIINALNLKSLRSKKDRLIEMGIIKKVSWGLYELVENDAV
jgi:uncharacterized membrane protein